VSEADAYSIFSDAIWTILIASGPVLAIATLVGLGIAFFSGADADPGDDPDLRA
jgi:flagellar biosynthetic protein FliQ